MASRVPTVAQTGGLSYTSKQIPVRSRKSSTIGAIASVFRSEDERDQQLRLEWRPQARLIRPTMDSINEGRIWGNGRRVLLDVDDLPPVLDRQRTRCLVPPLRPWSSSAVGELGLLIVWERGRDSEVDKPLGMWGRR